MAVGVYIRCSTVGQNEAGQRREIQKWLKGNNVTDVRWFVDKESGDSLDRPGFDKLQAAIFAGEVDAVVCWKLDRLSRSLRDGVNTLGDWCDRGIRVVSVTEGLDFSSKLGKLLSAVFFALAETEQQTRKERQQAGIAAVLADPELRAEKYRGRQPGSTSADPARAKSLRARGLTVAEIASALNVSKRTAARYLAA